MWFEASNLDLNNVLYLNVNVKNANEDAANLLEIRWDICVSFNIRQNRNKLSVRPHFKDQTINQLPSGRDFNFIIAQELPLQLVREWHELVREWHEKKLYLFFDKLEVIVQSATNSKISVRLPLWYGVWIIRIGKEIKRGQIWSIGPDLSNLPIRQ
jgi:hypothetical protein